MQEHIRGYKLLTINFTQFPVSLSKVMDELSSSLGPYEIGMGVGSAHLLLSAIALRVEEGAVAGAALRQAHVSIIGIEEILTALVILDMQGTERAVQLLAVIPSSFAICVVVKQETESSTLSL